MCPYANYIFKDNYNREIIWCEKKDNMCPYTRYCPQLGKIIPTDKMDSCTYSKEVPIPKGASRIRKTISNNSFLYVDIKQGKDVFTHKIKNPFDYIPDYVFVRKGADGKYKLRVSKCKEK